MPARLGLGTAQFGMHYGISNNRGRPGEAEVSAVLANAENLGIGYLDTAFAYPNSETLIGRLLPRNAQFRIVTKTTPIEGQSIVRESKGRIIDAVAISMDRLRTGHVYGLLVHHASDLKKPGWEYLVEALTEVQSRGWVGKIGASVYNGEELELVESRFNPGLVQAPFNILDTRLVSSNCFKRLKSGGTEMHARSLFLQGLLLMPPLALPDFFEPLKPVLMSLRSSWAEEGGDPLTACLGYVMGHSAIDVGMVGVNSLQELQQIVEASTRNGYGQGAPVDFGTTIDEKYLDPSRWPSFAH